MKEWFRKLLVSIKRNPNYIPLVFLCISCLVFNLNLTSFSKTISLINEPGMGLCSFAIALCSYLSIITYLGAYPRRQKVKIGALIIVILMLVISIGCQFIFSYFIKYGTILKENPIEINEKRLFVNTAKQTSSVHIVFLSISLVLILLLPVYKKLLAKINTSISIEDNQVNNVQVDKEIE